jgi:UDP-MurNAc hydroxylase
VEITYLGHAGFLIETDAAVVVADPWLSPGGAFDSAWMQLPENDALAPLVIEKLSRSPKARFLYISHEHRDHFDADLLARIAPRGFTVVIPRLRRPALRDWFARYGAASVVECADGAEIPIPGGSLKVYVEDSGLNRDSALLVRAGGRAFLDLNDCKVHDRIARIRDEDGPVHFFTAQFSGAVWHPICYEYDPATFKAIAHRKRMGKFEAVARAIETLAPEAFIASAGPACFLDPDLFHLNFDADGIFPRPSAFFAYARKRLRRSGVPVLLAPAPGDVLCATGAVREGPGPRPTDDELPAYLRAYADRRASVLAGRIRPLSGAEALRVLRSLRDELAGKLDTFVLRARVERPLYVGLEELPDRLLRVDFAAHRIEEATRIEHAHRYTLRARAPDVARVLERRLTWDEFLLSFRHRMSRVPDQYDPLLHGFLAIEQQDLGAFCDAVLAAESRQERIEIEADGRRWSIQRYCPHQGADLAQAWVQGSCLVCPRHRWQFDLERHGRCQENGASIRARPAEGDQGVPEALPAVGSATG